MALMVGTAKWAGISGDGGSGRTGARGLTTVSRPIPLPGMQVGRAFAALFVVCFHAIGMWQNPKYGNITVAPNWIMLARVGVDFFFVLSGFIILHAHMDDIGRPAGVGRYMWRRAVRVYPIYWICLTLSVGALVVMGSAPPLWDIALNYGLMDPFFHPRIIVAAWTLFHEILFYLAFAGLIIHRRMGLLLFCAWILTAIILFHHPGGPATITNPVNSCFLFGMIARMAMPRIPARVFFLPLAAGLAGFAAMTIVAANFLLDDMVLGLAGGLVVLGLALADQAGAWKVPRLLLFLGAASYVIYLTHYAVFSFAFRLLGSFSARPAILSVAAMMVLAAAAGGAIHWAIERPILRRLRS